MIDFQQIQEFVKSNQFIQGGLALGVTGGIIAAILGFLRSIPVKVWRLIDRYCFLTLTYDRFQESPYWWALAWMEEIFKDKRQKNIQVRSTWYKKGEGENYALQPNYGRYYFRHKWKFGYIDVQKKEGKENHDIAIYSILTVKLFLGNKKNAEEIITRGKFLYAPDESSPWIYECLGGNWARRKKISDVDVSNYIYPDGFYEGIFSRLLRFEKSRDWYTKHNIPYRLTFMFHGQPGNGKTSYAKVIAWEKKKNLCVMSLNEISSDRIFNHAITTCPENSIIVIEDIDCFDSTKARKSKPLSADPEEDYGDFPDKLFGVTLHGLLNGTDGILAADEGQIMIWTTNHKEKLDPALIRPGRVDETIEFLNPTKEAFIKMGLKFFPDKEKEITNLSEKYTSESAAFIQGIFSKYEKYEEAEEQFLENWKNN